MNLQARKTMAKDNCVEEDDYELEFWEIMDEYRQQNRMGSFEGNSGLGKLNKFFEDLGYSGHNYRFGSPLESFLADNPGCIDAMLDWVKDHGDDNDGEWRENLESCLELEKEDDEDEE